MSTEDFVLHLFCRIDDHFSSLPRHPLACLHPSEVMTIGFLFGLKGLGPRKFYRWLNANFRPWFPSLPHRTRLFRNMRRLWPHSSELLAEPTLFGIIDTYGIELIHPRREGRSKHQIGRKGISNHRWIVGAKFCLVCNKFGQIVGWSLNAANEHDTSFRNTIEAFQDEMILFADSGFHSAQGDPPNLKICARGTWNDRMLIETIFSMQAVIMHTKRMTHRTVHYLEMRIAYVTAVFNLLIGWHGWEPEVGTKALLSIAEFSL